LEKFEVGKVRSWKSSKLEKFEVGKVHKHAYMVIIPVYM